MGAISIQDSTDRGMTPEKRRYKDRLTKNKNV